MAHFLDGKISDAEDVDAARGPLWKGKTRLEEKESEKKLTVVDEKAFKATVWKRDRSHCRCCGRKVVKTMELVAERGEVHHCHGRGGDLRFDDVHALLLCKKCHQRVTGKVNDKLVIIPSKTIEVKGRPLIDARAPVTFKEAA